VGVGSQLEKAINQLAASEQTMEALKHGELFKRHGEEAAAVYSS
jgi:hypothetical protein